MLINWNKMLRSENFSTDINFSIVVNVDNRPYEIYEG